jgi:hypothetical protein
MKKKISWFIRDEGGAITVVRIIVLMVKLWASWHGHRFGAPAHRAE